jgi:hypothetical protein
VNHGDIELVEGCSIHQHRVDIKPTNFKGDEIEDAKAEENDDAPKQNCSKKRKQSPAK